MVLVAIAGGTSPTLGKSIVLGIQAAGKHDAVILSRQNGNGKQSTTDKKWDAPIRYVDYSSHESLTDALKDVHTCISVLKVIPFQEAIKHHENLLQACIAAGVKRFTPSDWGHGEVSTSQMMTLSDKPALWKMCVEKGIPNGIECMQVSNGWFMNYLGRGKDFSSLPSDQVSSEEDYVISGLEDKFCDDYIFIPKGIFYVPINPKTDQPAKISLTHIHDIGKIMAAALDLSKGEWNGHIGMHSTACTFEEIYKILIEKCHISPDNLSLQRLTEKQCDKIIDHNETILQKDPSKSQAVMLQMTAQFCKYSCIEEIGAGLMDPELNRRVGDNAPHMIDVEEYLVRTWGRD